MSNNPTNINYTAADIQQYLEGKMSPQQMNALEKAALEDPFLQEAIEGYETVPATSWKPALETLRQGFAATAPSNKDTAKVVGFGSKRFGWIKYAAAVLILGGGFTTIYLINQNQPGNPEATTVAAAEKSSAPTLNEAVVSQKADSISSLANNKATTSNNTTFANSTKEIAFTPSTVTFDDQLKKQYDSTVFAINDEKPVSAKPFDLIQSKDLPPTNAAEIAVDPSETKSSAPAMPNLIKRPAAKPATTGTRVESVAAATISLDNYVLSDNDVSKKKAMPVAAEKEAERNKNAGPQQNARFYKQEALNNSQGLMGYNNNKEVNRNFVAQVVDNNNNPLPFANINVQNEGFGTYADSKGNVRLISTDSVIPIEVRSLGFQSQTVVLRSTQQPATIRLKEDADIAYQEKTIDRKQATNNVMSRRAYLQKDAAQNAEPADGWEKYDTYISNNLVIPDDLVKKNVHGEVALSFDVQQNGVISNIKVDKSLCTDCDEIAKRIVAQGPQWKVKKGKKAKARVTVQF